MSPASVATERYVEEMAKEVAQETKLDYLSMMCLRPFKTYNLNLFSCFTYERHP